MEELIGRTVGPAIDVQVATSAGLWTSYADSNQLENALLNLCINGRDAMPEGGRLKIETRNETVVEDVARNRNLPPGEYVTLSVEDTGTGMRPEVIERAFDPFFTTKPIGMGTGLGLSMVYGFARQSGGQVWIEFRDRSRHHSMALSTPSPRRECRASREPELIYTPRTGQGETVLVIDDEPTVRLLVKEVLEEAGYTAIEAADGLAGLTILDLNIRIDLLITDVGLPGGMSGRQVADISRMRRPDLKVLFITGYAESINFSHANLDPRMRVLTKPFTLTDLAKVISELITECEGEFRRAPVEPHRQLPAGIVHTIGEEADVPRLAT